MVILKEEKLDAKEEDKHIVLHSNEYSKNSQLLNVVRDNFNIFGSISILFGLGFAFCFYKSGIGANVLIFAIIIVGLLIIMMNKLSIPIKKATKAYYAGIILLALSCMLTTSAILQFLNVVGIFLLLDLSLLHQLYEDYKWDFSKHIQQMFLLPVLCFASVNLPFSDSFHNLRKTKILKNEKAGNIFLGIIISIPLLGVIVGLLSSADLLFNKMTHNVITMIFTTNEFYVILMILIGYIGCYSIICGSVAKVGIEEKQNAMNKADASIAGTVLTMLSIVYVLFCGIQILYLFNNGLFVLPAEFTFSEYARRGFFELLTVTIINIILMLVSTLCFKESKWIRFLLVLITACTYIMIGSAVYRMLLYITVYGLTFLRLFVLLFLFIDTFVLAGVIISVFHKKFPLFGYCVSIVTVCYVMFTLAKPDYFIAAYNIQNQKNNVTEEDVYYLTEELSFDAAPIVVPFLEEINSSDKYFDEENSDVEDSDIEWTRKYGKDAIKYYKENIIDESEARGLRDFNLSAYIANKLVVK